ncbi:MAG: PcfJ domain-containing protein, partial [Bacteroidota bacterium]
PLCAVFVVGTLSSFKKLGDPPRAELTVYHIYKHSLIDFYDAGKMTFVKSAELPTRKEDFAAKNNRLHYKAAYADSFHLHENAILSEAERSLVFEMLHLLYPTSLQENAASQLVQFLQEVLPHFVERFAHRMDQETLFQHPDRWAEWFMVWQRHMLRTEEELEEDQNEYYETDFATVVKYIPEFLWWNNGYYFSNGDKNFHFGSECFCFLAAGGSIRKAPDWRHYTRRMARTLMNLPYYFDQQSYDMYIYSFCQSLGAGPQLSRCLQQYIRHPDNAAAMQEEMDRWNPIIHKLTSERFENLGEAAALELVGFLYHCLRDQPEYSVQGRTVDQLITDSNEYYERIHVRANIRENRRREREARRAANATMPDILKWDKHPSIHAFNYKGFQIIELTNEHMLQLEGRTMNHCVGSYARRCANKQCTIWSLRQLRQVPSRSCVTIEISKHRHIIQMRGRFNATPSKEHRDIIKRWAAKEQIEI